MRLSFEIEWLRFALLAAITPEWTRWFLPLNLTVHGFLTSYRITLTVLWTLHLGIQIPLFRPYKKAAREYLPKYKGL